MAASRGELLELCVAKVSGRGVLVCPGGREKTCAGVKNSSSPANDLLHPPNALLAFLVVLPDS